MGLVHSVHSCKKLNLLDSRMVSCSALATCRRCLLSAQVTMHPSCPSRHNPPLTTLRAPSPPHAPTAPYALLTGKEDGRKLMVVQTAPAVRVAISETLGLAPGAVTANQMVTALKMLGFDYVFGALSGLGALYHVPSILAALLRRQGAGLSPRPCLRPLTPGASSCVDFPVACSCAAAPTAEPSARPPGPITTCGAPRHAVCCRPDHHGGGH
jgi:hypothetical protein